MRPLVRGVGLALLPLVALAREAGADTPGELAERLRKATAVLSEMASGRHDTAIPREMLSRARALAVLSAKRASDGRWSPPAFFTVGGGSVGLPLGGQVIDPVLLVMTDRGVESLLESETTLGGDASVTAGPKSLHDGANTDGTFKAEIFILRALERVHLLSTRPQALRAER